MKIKVLPRSDADRLIALGSLDRKLRRTAEAEWALPPTVGRRCKSILPVFRAACRTATRSKARRMAAHVRMEEAFRVVGRFVSHFIQGLNHAIERGELAVEDRAYYGLGREDASVPDLRRRAALVVWAEAVLRGEMARVDDGGRALGFPSAVDVERVFSAFLVAEEEFEGLKAVALRAAVRVRVLRAAVDRFLKGTWSWLGLHFADLSLDKGLTGSGRDIRISGMAAYGVRFVWYSRSKKAHSGKRRRLRRGDTDGDIRVSVGGAGVLYRGGVRIEELDIGRVGLN